MNALEALRKCRDALVLHGKQYPPMVKGYCLDAIAAADAALAQPVRNSWRDAVDDELSVCHMVASDDPRESIKRLIDWHCSVHIDPDVSSAAQALIERGRREVLAQPAAEPQVIHVHTHSAPTVTLPPLPSHPEIHTYNWTPDEFAVMEQWRDQIIAALKAAGVAVRP